MATYLTRTFGTPTSTKKFTISVWVKRTTIGSSQALLQQNADYYYFNGDAIDFEVSIGRIKTNRLFRDPNAWYHIVITADTTLATADDRLKMYVNGVQETSFASRTNPSQNADFANFNSANAHKIGQRQASPANDLNFKGILSHYHFCDGYAYDASAFGSTDSVTGEWKINTSPSVTYGNNGFFILKDGNSVTDQSGNTNNFTAYGNLTNTEDCPSNNFATLNPLQTNLTTLHNGNTSAGTTSNYQYGVSTFGMNSGKYYFEMKVSHGCAVIGIQDMNKAQDRIFGSGTFWYSGSQSYHLDGFSKFTHDSYGDISSSSTDYPTYGSGDIIMMAVDLDNNKLAYGKNGTWYNNANPSNGTNMVTIDDPETLDSGFYGVVAADTCGATDVDFEINFGNGYFGTTAVATNSGNGYAGAEGKSIFNYQVPTNYCALNTKGLNT